MKSGRSHVRLLLRRRKPTDCSFSIRNKKKPPESTKTLLPLNLILRSGITTSCRHVGTFPQECSVPSISRGSSFFSKLDTASVTPFPPVLLEAPIPDPATRAEPKLVELQEQQWPDGLWTFTFFN